MIDSPRSHSIPAAAGQFRSHYNIAPRGPPTPGRISKEPRAPRGRATAGRRAAAKTWRSAIPMVLSYNHTGGLAVMAASGPSYQVTPEQIEAYDRDGVVFLPGLVGESWIERVRGGIERSLVDETGEAIAYF